MHLPVRTTEPYPPPVNFLRTLAEPAKQRVTPRVCDVNVCGQNTSLGVLPFFVVFFWRGCPFKDN